MITGYFLSVEKNNEKLGLYFLDRYTANKAMLDLRAQGYNALFPEEHDIYTDSGHAVSIANQFFKEQGYG